MWNFDISAAPRGKTVTVTRKVKTAEGIVDRSVEETRREYILAVHDDGTVVQSYWIPPRHAQSGALLDGNRWSGFNVGKEPIAWAPWPVFEIHANPEEVGAHGDAESVPVVDAGSRLVAGRTATATSEDGRDGSERRAPISQETATETMGGTGDDCSFGNRGVWPPQGGASSSRGNDSLSVVTAGETAPQFIIDDCGGGV